MESLAVVKDFDPLEDGRTRGKDLMMDQSSFERAPKAFHQSVIVAVATVAHARNDSGLSQSLPVGEAGVLNAPVRVMPPVRLEVGVASRPCPMPPEAAW